MKIRLHLKDPDGISDSIEEAVKDSLEGVSLSLSSEELEAVAEVRNEEFNEAIKKWVDFSEYVTIEIDTVTGEAEVISCT